MTKCRTNTWLFRSLPIALAAAACAPSTRSGPPAIPVGRPQVESNRQIIAAREITESYALDAYQLIVLRRPEYLTDRSHDILKPPPAPAVYINGLLAGDIAVLRQIATNMLVEVRHIPPGDASLHHGEPNAGGEILLYTYDPRTAQRP